MNDQKKLFSPTSIAVVGASRRDGTLGKMFLDALVRMNYKGTLLPVNPKAGEINGVRCYPDIKTLPVVPDLAVILLPKEMVLTTIDHLHKKGVKNIVVISAGFKEVGSAGEKRERDLLKRIRQYKMRMIGPNSMGLFNTHPDISLNATFSPTEPLHGHVGFISQSGALGVAVLELARQLNLGFSIFVSTGNKADVGDVDCLQFLAQDQNTKVIIFYQEVIDHPSQFRASCQSVVVKKPILTLKAGRTGSGLRAASSHTGALATDDLITGAFLKQSGLIRCETLQELLDTARTFVDMKLPAGNQFAVVTNAGGPGILASDALEREGLRLPALSENTKRKLQLFLPEEAGLQNPVDMIASATHQTYRQTCEVLEADPDINGLFVIIVKPPVDTTPLKIISELQALIKKSKKPFFLTVMARPEIDEKNNMMNNNPVIFAYPEAAARVAGHSVRYQKIKNRFSQVDITHIKDRQHTVKTGQPRQASFNEIIALLESYNLPFSEYVLTSDPAQAVEFYKQHNKIVLKIANEQIIHKSDQDLVKLNLTSEEEISDTFDEMIKKAKTLLPREIDPVILVQKYIPKGIEIVLGTKRDPVYGPLIMFGIGGIFIELYRDVAFRVAPLNREDITEMIAEIQGKKILEGFRQLPVVDMKILIQLILNFSKLVEENPHIIEMDLNPLIWSAQQNKPIVVDSRCTLNVNEKIEY